MTGLPAQQRSLTISSAVWIECTNVTDRLTDRGMNTEPQQRLRLRIVTCGKNQSSVTITRKKLSKRNTIHVIIIVSLIRHHYKDKKAIVTYGHFKLCKNCRICTRWAIISGPPKFFCV